MTREYKILFKVLIKHDYYQSGQSNDFEFAPTLETIRLMENHDLLFRNEACGFYMAYKKTNGQLLRPLTGTLRLRFYIKLKNPDFEKFTNVGGAGSSALGTRVFYFTNLSETGDINLATELAALGGFVSNNDKATLVPTNITIPTLGSSSVSLFTYKASVGEEAVMTEVVTGKQFARLSLKGLPAGFYGTRWLGPATNERLYYDPENRPGFGVIEIFKDQTLDYDIPITYTLTFKRKEQVWSYYLMDKSNKFTPDIGNGAVSGLSLQYTPGSGSIFPPSANFPQILPGSQSDREKALISSTATGLGIDPSKIYLFKSDVALPSFERGELKLKLQNGASTLLPPLPLLDARSGSADIFVNL